MSGQNMHTYNKLSRREFVKKSLLTVSAFTMITPLLNASCSKPRIIGGGIINDNAKAGHLIRDGFKGKPTKTINLSIAIVGAGVSGLAAGYHLNKNSISDFLVFDLAPKQGGNSVSDSNAVSAYPWAAHYLPIVNNSNQELISFLHEHQIITGFDGQGLPVYNDYYLCFDPEERLFINGHWQDGLVPNFGVSQQEKKEIATFFELVAEYRNKTGNDGKPVFEIPISQSSQDDQYKALDKVSFADFLKTNHFSSPHLLWYLNYCCKDDYGSTLKDTSAYAGLHYFCARRAKAANAESSAVLTWPEGNAFLVNKLHQPCKQRIKTNQLITSLHIVENQVELVVYNTLTEECIKYICKQVILSTPQYINQYILPESLINKRKATPLFEYSPWMVANITLTELPEYKGEPLSWDNVLYHSKSLGYVNACHQHLNKDHNGYVLTYYLPLTDLPAKEARHAAREKTHEDWVKDIVSDLKIAHEKIEIYITNIDVKIWGHGMIKPKPDFIFNSEKEEYTKPIDNKVFFAHTDLSGISIFEEGFSQGMNAAKQIIQLYDKAATA
jgi:predicted NAD/FAD-binding protein